MIAIIAGTRFALLSCDTVHCLFHFGRAVCTTSYPRSTQKTEQTMGSVEKGFRKSRTTYAHAKINPGELLHLDGRSGTSSLGSE